MPRIRRIRERAMFVAIFQTASQGPKYQLMFVAVVYRMLIGACDST